VAYDDTTLHAILDLPNVIGIKIATLDSVMTFQRLAGILRSHPDKLLITGEDRFLGYSIMLGARSALVGMGAALPGLQAGLLRSYAGRDWPAFHARSAACDHLAEATFVPPMEGYVRRMLWAAAADGGLPAEACDDPWGPTILPEERAVVERAVRDARSAGG
jgi:4-hydroxy-tetrahydrodipicolinate synthase